MELQALRKRQNLIVDYQPYLKQVEFHNALVRERLFMAGNQLGKTYSGACEMSYHLTGEYPKWWQGRRFNDPVIAWASGISGQSVRDTTQRLLIGRPNEYGTGTIPEKRIHGEPKRAMGVPDLLDSVQVKHITGGISRIYFKSYEQGREKWQGETLDIVWFDEEPPEDIYTEGLTRTNATGGMAYMTFTPLLGMSNVVSKFITEQSDDRAVINMTIDDVEHYTEAEKATIINSYPAHEREARAKGIPMLGSGRIFTVPEEELSVTPFELPKHWKRICAIDFGWDHPFAAVWLAQDPDTNIKYVYDCFKIRESTPLVQSASIKLRGDWIPVTWPHDGLQNEKGTGVMLSRQYRDQGLNMLNNHAQFISEGMSDETRASRTSVEAGLLGMADEMQIGAFKVFSTLNDWFEEYRMYHRKDGKIVKLRDDLMSATRYGWMSICQHGATDPKNKMQSAPRRRTNWITG